MAFPSVYEMTNSLTPVNQSSTKTYDQQADGDFVDIWNTNPYIAIKVIAGSTAIDTWIQKINMKLYKTGTPAGSAYIRVWDANNNVVESVEFTPNTHLTTTSTVYSFYLPKPIQLKVNYKVGLQYNGSTSSGNRINARYTPSGTTQSGFSVSTSSNLDAGLTNRNVYMTFDANTTGTALMTNRRRQHFWDYFSGATLNSRWTFKAGTGGVVVSQGMSDEVNGGFKLVMTNAHIGTYDFAQKRQFNYDGAVIIGSHKRVNSAGIIGNGFVGDNTTSDSGGGTGYMDRRVTRLLIRNASLTIQGMTSNASGATYHDTGVTSDDNYHLLKTELTSGGTHFSIDGVLGHSSTGSEHETDEKLQPMLMAWSNGSGSGGNTNYCEVYNT